MNITYDKYNGLFVADGKAVETAKSILENNKDVTVSQGLLVDAIRLNMKENNIPPDSVCFIFNDRKITVNEHYDFLADKPFFPKIKAYMTSGPVVAIALS